MLRIFLSDADMLNDEARFERALKTVSQKRREKAQAYLFRGDRNLCLCAGMLLESWMRLLGLEDKRIEIAANGKPRIAGCPELHFNLTHSGHYAALAIADDEVGVDIERVVKDRMDVAERFFTREELYLVSGQVSEREREDMFFRLWTLKESFMKATGLGFELPLNEFSIDIPMGGKPISVSQSVCPGEYNFYEFVAPHGYKLSACTTDSAAEKAAHFVSEWSQFANLYVCDGKK